jgi:hypothetical protein
LKTVRTFAATTMRGRISRTLDDQDHGTITGDDGADYAFHSGSLVDASSRRLLVGDVVEFVPINATTSRHAGLVRFLWERR